VKKVNCQYTFAVYTKWDELTEKLNKGNPPKISLQRLREKNQETFRKAVNSETEIEICPEDNIFFVDSQSVFRNSEASTSHIVS